MKEKLKGVTPETWARTGSLLIALINQILAIFGKDVLPFGENQVYQIISISATVITGIIAWWKNNSFTKKAQLADQYLAELRDTEDEEDA